MLCYVNDNITYIIGTEFRAHRLSKQTAFHLWSGHVVPEGYHTIEATNVGIIDISRDNRLR